MLSSRNLIVQYARSIRLVQTRNCKNVRAIHPIVLLSSHDTNAQWPAFRFVDGNVGVCGGEYVVYCSFPRESACFPLFRRLRDDGRCFPHLYVLR